MTVRRAGCLTTSDPAESCRGRSHTAVRAPLWWRAVAVATLLAAGALPAPAQHLLDIVPASLTIPDQPRVAYWADSYGSAALRSWMQKVLQRTAFYADHILQQLEERGMPAELVFLPAIESDYDAWATSPAGAVGLWQLMRGTAQLYGLVTDEMIDERRDFWKATDVALRILEANRRELGSWELALAAYNAGKGRVRRDVRNGGTSDFWELRRNGLLPRETRDFVPRYYGLVLALRRYAASDSPAVDDLHRWRRVMVPDGVDLRQLGELSGVASEVLERANAELNFGLAPAGGESNPYLLKVPVDSYEKLTALLEDSSITLVRLHRHVIRSGDTLSELAEAFEVSVALIRRFNTRVNPRRMQIGVGLFIPLLGDFDPTTVRFPDLRDPRSFELDYRVVAGDSLWRIARLHNTTVEALAAANGLPPNAVLQPDQLLQVPPPTLPPTVAYRVVAGDSLWRIARLHDTTVEALAAANGLPLSAVLQPGQVLQVPPRALPPAVAARA